MSFQAWAPNVSFWDVQRTLLEEAKRRLEDGGIEIPFPQRIVVVAPSEEERARRSGKAT